jgi:hypothetical protein
MGGKSSINSNSRLRNAALGMSLPVNIIYADSTINTTTYRARELD